MTESESSVKVAAAFGSDLSEAARNLRLAGLGAVALVQRKGRHAFQKLIEEGRTFETRQPTRLDRMLQEALGQVRLMSRRVETGLQDTGRAVLHRFGIPSHADITALIARVEQLTAKVEALGREQAVGDQKG